MIKYFERFMDLERSYDMNEWNEMNNTENNGAASEFMQGTLSATAYNIAIGVHLLVGLVITYGLALRMPYVFPQIYSVHPIVFSLGFLALGFIGGHIAARGNYILSLIGYGLNILAFGTLLSLVTVLYPVQYIVLAAILTTVVVLTMTVAAVIFPNAFLSMGKTIFIALIGLAIAEFVSLLLGVFYPNIFAIIGIFIFSLYVGYDWARGQKYPSTASYACFTALQLYMDIINIFIRILRILGSRRR